LSDAPFIVECNLCLALETERRQLAAEQVTAGVQQLLQDSAKGLYFVAEAEGRAVGQLLITYEWSDWRNGNFWWIQSVYVLEDFRRRGIFRALFNHVRELAGRRSDICGLRLYMDAHNASARSTYGSLGLKPTNYEMFEIDFVLKHD
jgi:GNAT superfamily N-acetyltransferase